MESDIKYPPEQDQSSLVDKDPYENSRLIKAAYEANNPKLRVFAVLVNNAIVMPSDLPSSKKIKKKCAFQSEILEKDAFHHCRTLFFDTNVSKLAKECASLDGILPAFYESCLCDAAVLSDITATSSSACAAAEFCEETLGIKESLLPLECNRVRELSMERSGPCSRNEEIVCGAQPDSPLFRPQEYCFKSACDDPLRHRDCITQEELEGGVTIFNPDLDCCGPLGKCPALARRSSVGQGLERAFVWIFIVIEIICLVFLAVFWFFTFIYKVKKKKRQQQKLLDDYKEVDLDEDAGIYINPMFAPSKTSIIEKTSRESEEMFYDEELEIDNLEFVETSGKILESTEKTKRIDIRDKNQPSNFVAYWSTLGFDPIMVDSGMFDETKVGINSFPIQYKNMDTHVDVEEQKSELLNVFNNEGADLIDLDMFDESPTSFGKASWLVDRKEASIQLYAKEYEDLAYNSSVYIPRLVCPAAATDGSAAGMAKSMEFMEWIEIRVDVRGTECSFHVRNRHITTRKLAGVVEDGEGTMVIGAKQDGKHCFSGAIKEIQFKHFDSVERLQAAGAGSAVLENSGLFGQQEAHLIMGAENPAGEVYDGGAGSYVFKGSKGSWLNVPLRNQPGHDAHDGFFTIQTKLKIKTGAGGYVVTKGDLDGSGLYWGLYVADKSKGKEDPTVWLAYRPRGQKSGHRVVCSREDTLPDSKGLSTGVFKPEVGIRSPEKKMKRKESLKKSTSAMKSAISLYAEHDRTEQAETGQAEEVRKVMPSGALAKFKAAANTVKVDITAAKALSGGRYAEYNIDQKALLSKARQDEERLAELRKAQKEREEAEEAALLEDQKKKEYARALVKEEEEVKRNKELRQKAVRDREEAERARVRKEEEEKEESKLAGWQKLNMQLKMKEKLKEARERMKARKEKEEEERKKKEEIARRKKRQAERAKGNAAAFQNKIL